MKDITMKKYVLLATIMTVLNVSAQRFIDDIYFTPKDAQQEHVRLKGKVKNGAREVVFVDTIKSELKLPDTLTVQVDTATSVMTDSMVIDLAEGTYLNGFTGSEEDFEYTQRIYRFHNPRITVQVGDPAYNDIYFLDDDLWNVYIDPYNYAYVTPTWTNPYYWDYMYRPYAYGSWTWRWNPYASWGWNSYWGWNHHWGWDPYWGYAGCWNCYDPCWGYPYWGHHHHHHHHPFPPSHHHGIHSDRYADNKEGQRRRENGVRVGTQIDRKTAIMGGSATGNRLNSTTVLAGERESHNRVNVTTNTRRLAGTATTTTTRHGMTTSSRAQAIRPVSTQRRVSTMARTGSSDVRRTTTTTQRATTNTSVRRTGEGNSSSYTSGRGKSMTTSQGRVSTPTTSSSRSSYAPSYSGSRSSSSSYRSSSPSRSSSSSYRSSSSSYRSNSSSSSRSSGFSSSYSRSGSSSGGGRR